MCRACNYFPLYSNLSSQVSLAIKVGHASIFPVISACLWYSGNLSLILLKDPMIDYVIFPTYWICALSVCVSVCLPVCLFLSLSLTCIGFSQSLFTISYNLNKKFCHISCWMTILRRFIWSIVMLASNFCRTN